MERPEIPDKMFFRIGEAGELVGVEPHVLRYWEGEFRMRPQRSASGQRMYRRKDLEKFLRIKQLVHEQGFTIAGARKALQEGRSGVVPGVEVDRAADAARRIACCRQRIREVRRTLLAVPIRDLPTTR